MKRQIAIALFLTGTFGVARADIVLDGIFDAPDTYDSSQSVTWYNGHQTANSIYGDFDNQSFATTIRYGTAQLAGDPTGKEYFFLFVQVPLYAKNMIWDSEAVGFPIKNTDPDVGLTEDDVFPYRLHHETHHNPGDLRLNFNTATGSEKVVFVDGSGVGQFEADLAGDAKDKFGLIGFKDSVDYLFDNNLATKDLSLARDRTMSFEFQFELDGAMNSELLGYVLNGIEFHLSPERVPAPGALALLGLAALGRRRRRIAT